jgi:hypothetical protein
MEEVLMKEKRQSKTQPRETVGQTVYDNLHKQPEVTNIKEEIAPGMLEHYWNDLVTHIDKVSKQFTDIFYIEVIFLRPKPFKGMIIKPNFFGRPHCPSPTWGQHVYRCTSLIQQIEFLWAIPFKDKAEELKMNALNLTPGEKTMLEQVFAFDHGVYELLARKLNNEPKEGSNLVIINQGEA